MENRNEILLKIVINNWNSQLTRADKLFSVLTDKQLSQTIGDNRNSGVYLLGHLTAINDAMLPILGLGERLFPELSEIYIERLRENWKQVNVLLASKLEELISDQLFEKHNSVSLEDFKKEPHRNKLNVILSRTSHLSYHLGQLIMLDSKK
jgi:hypothetical protein